MSLMVLSIGNEGVSISTVGERKVSTSGHIKQSKKKLYIQNGAVDNMDWPPKLKSSKSQTQENSHYEKIDLLIPLLRSYKCTL